jgi:antirestriction protein ArdC
MSNKVYDIITDRIVKQLEAGEIPWSKPWTGGALPTNAVSKKAYKGINVLMLYGQYNNPYWMTFKQAASLGGHVRKGEKSTPIIYWMMRKQQSKTDKTTGDKTTVTKEYDRPILRYYSVFNVEQCEDLPDEFTKLDSQIDFIPINKAEEIIQGYPRQPEIRHKEQRAYYNPTSDFINMPSKDSFDDVESYYSVLFHEMIHSTGHESRLNRLIDTASFGSEDYSKEELIAELGAAFLRAETGINAESQMTSSAAYIQSWIKALKNDTKMIIQASSKGQKATDYILNKLDVI